MHVRVVEVCGCRGGVLGELEKRPPRMDGVPWMEVSLCVDAVSSSQKLFR